MELMPDALQEHVVRARRVTVFTGAGVSAESGLDTFRDARSGLWSRYDPMTLATPDAFVAEPDLVWGWYRWRCALVQACEPNAGHRALAEWGERAGVTMQVVTQNVDDLHERAGSGVVAHLHGSLFELRCSRCERPAPDEQPLPVEQVERLAPPVCHECGGNVRPGVVWFGEQLPSEGFARAEAAMSDADLVLVVGTSGTVYPAAGLPYVALERGIPVVEIGPQETDFSADATILWRSTAAVALPELVRMLSDGGQ